MTVKNKLPAVGQRIIKSAVGVFLCYAVFLLRGESGIPFYSILAVLWCIQPYTGKTLTMAFQRTTGTLIGAGYGLVSILLEIYVFDIYNTLAGYALTALMIVPLIYTTVLLHRQNASYFSCVVFLSITVNHITDPNPFLFVGNRVLDTFIGIIIGVALSSLKLHYHFRKNVLYIAELDDMLSPIGEQLSPYSKVEINRLLDEGLQFSITTMRTPASLMKPLEDVRIKLPVIVMDGAALYDIKEKSYIKVYIISNETVSELRALMAESGMRCFTNALCDDILIIYYRELVNEGEQRLYNDLHRSPYRNYIRRDPHPDDKVIYLMMIDETEKIQRFRKKLNAAGFDERLKILCYPSVDYPGFSYIKIYNKNANRENMREYLFSLASAEKAVTVGARDENDIVADKNINSIVKAIKGNFEKMF